MITSARERSPANRQGVTKVIQGFSIPPNGNEGGINRTSYLSEANSVSQEDTTLICSYIQHCNVEVILPISTSKIQI